MDDRGLRYLRDGKAARAQGNGIQEGRRKPPLFAFADGFGMGGGASTTGAAGVDGVGCRAVGAEWELDSRGLCDLRDGNRLTHKATAFKRGGESRPSLRGQTSSVSAAEGARLEGLRWTASASELSTQSGSWTLESYVICVTVSD